MCYAPRAVYLISEEAEPNNIYICGSAGGGGSPGAAPARSVSPPSTDKWSCTLCTYLNWPRANKCVQCRSPRRRASPLTASNLHEALAPLHIRTPSSESLARRGSPSTPSPRHGDPPSIISSAGGPRKWSCPTCTYENYPRSRRCAMCQSWRADAEEGEGAAAASPPLSNYEYERRLKQLRRRQREADWGWLNACLATVEGDLQPVDAYLSSGQFWSGLL